MGRVSQESRFTLDPCRERAMLSQWPETNLILRSDLDNVEIFLVKLGELLEDVLHCARAIPICAPV